MDDRDCGTTLAKTDKFGFWSTNKDGIDAPKVERSVPAAQADKFSSLSRLRERDTFSIGQNIRNEVNVITDERMAWFANFQVLGSEGHTA